MNNLLGYATYIPAYRYAPAGGDRPDRIAAAFDEDSTTMAVAAVRELRRRTQLEPAQLLFCTSTPAYLDKTNAVSVHAASGLAPTVLAADVIGTARSSMAAVRSAVSQGGIVAMADVRVGKPGSADERAGADAAAALLFGPGPGIATVLSIISLTGEFLDRWRVPTEITGAQWEERFGFDQYRPLIIEAADRSLREADIDQADHVVVSSANAVARKAAAKLVQGRVSTTVAPVGFAGAADLGLALASVLDVAAAGQTILVISAVDGCDAILLETSTALPGFRQPVPLEVQIGPALEVPYVRYLGWRGLIEPEVPRRPAPDRPAGPPAARGAGWKFALAGARCRECAFLHLPPARVCRHCGSVDSMDRTPVSELLGTVATFTVDRLAYSPSPPVVDLVVDLDGGGRCALELADARVDGVQVGDRVDLVFRRLFTAGGVHNYFWKARVVLPQHAEEKKR